MSLLAPFGPLGVASARTGVSDRPAATARRDAVVEFVVHALLSDVDVARSVVPRLEAAVDESIVVTGPSMHTTSRTELIAELLEGDDAITDVDARITRTSTFGDSVFAEWSVRGRFTNAAFLDDDVLVEPTGNLVQACGMMVLDFTGDRVGRVQCFYDRSAMVEQVLRARA